MTNNKKNILFLSGYGIALILFLFFGLNGLINSLMANTFPNIKFMTVLALIIIVAWSMGLGVRHYLSSFNKDLRNNLNKSFLVITLISWIIVLILFTVA